MLELDLDREEREILLDYLETRLADVRMEIGRTSRLAYRDMLKRKKKVLEKCVACLRGEKPGTGEHAAADTRWDMPP